MLPYLIGLVALTLIWSAYACFDFAVRYSVFATVVVVVGIAAWVLWPRLRRRIKQKASAQLPDTGYLAPDAQARIQQAGEQIKAAQLQLRGAGIGARLPWYLLCGPSGSGKSSVIRHSGLSFVPSGSGQHADDVSGPTSLLNCWRNERAVLLDTAGRFATQASDQAEWQALMGQLGRHRPRGGLHGILVTVSVEELLGSDTTQLAQLGQDLALRAREANEAVHADAPVYLLLTKADRIVGFSGFAQRLEPQEQGQPWGFTWPQHPSQLDLVQRGARSFDDLCRDIHERCVQEVLLDEKQRDAQGIYSFVQNLARVRQPFLDFLAAFSLQGSGQTPLRLRGVYLTCAGQSQLPSLPAGTDTSASLMFPSPVALPVRAQQRSYFLSDLLTHVVFPDHALATLSARAQRNKRRLQLGGAGAMLTLGVTLWTLPLFAARENRVLQAEVSELIQDIERPSSASLLHDPKAQAAPTKTWLRAADLEAKLAGIEDATQLRYRFGMYQGRLLALSTRALFVELTLRRGIEPLLAKDRATLTNLSASNLQLDATQARTLRETLQRYLLLTSPAESAQPAVRDDIATQLANSIAQAWIAAGFFRTQHDATRVAQRFVELLDAQPELAQPRDTALVARARAQLLREDPMIAQVDKIIEGVNRGRPPIHLRDLLEVHALTNANTPVRAAFTRRAWEQTVREQLEHVVDPYSEHDWILGQAHAQPRAGREDRLARVYDHYLRAYQKEWRNFLDAIVVEVPADPAALQTTLAGLAHAAHSPFTTVAQAVHWNLDLPDPPPDAQDALLDQAKGIAGKKAKRMLGKAGPGAAKLAQKALDDRAKAAEGHHARFLTREGMRASFDPFLRFSLHTAPNRGGTPQAMPGPSAELLSYLDQLQQLRAALAQLQDGASERERAQKVRSLGQQVQGVIDQQPAQWRPWFDRVLGAPFRSAKTTSIAEHDRVLEQKWCELTAAIRTQLAGHYPFSPHASQDASLADVADLFHPQKGRIWSSYLPALAAVIEHTEEGFSPKVLPQDNPRRVDPRALQFLRAAQKLSRSLFAPGQDAPQLQFRLEAKPQTHIYETRFDLDGQAYRYINGPQHEVTMTWPGPDPKLGARLRARHSGKDVFVVKQGDWALFRVLEAGRIQRSSTTGDFTVTWTQHRSSQVTLRFHAARSPSPFFDGQNQRFLAPLRAPLLLAPVGLFADSPRCR